MCRKICNGFFPKKFNLLPGPVTMTVQHIQSEKIRYLRERFKKEKGETALMIETI